LIGAINSANGIGNVGGRPGQQAPFYGTGSGPYDVNAINKILSATGLNGQGGLIASLANQTGVPAQLALAMLQHESSFGSMGASVANNNPGNLKLTDLPARYGGTPGTAASDGGVFAHFKSIQDGIAAYFHLLQDVYGKFIANGDIAGLIGKYAPSSSNDTAGYISIVQKLIAQYAAAIVQKAAATGMGPLAAGEAALGIPGSQVTTQFSAAHQGIDLAGSPEGTPIHALQGGRVILSQWSDLYGNMVEVANATSGKIEEYYGHLADRLVKVGDLITEGTVIGTLGKTGSTATGVHLHLQMYDENGNVIDPMAALAKLFGTGQGPSAADLQVLLRYLNGIQDVNGAMTDLGPNLPVLAGQIAGVGDSIDAVVASILDGTAAMVNATDDILQHATYKNRDGSGQLAYINQNGGLSGAGSWTKKPGDGMSVGGPHFGDPIVTPPESMKGNDPTWGDLITATAGAATDATASVEDSAGKWTGAWHDMGDATVAEMQRADDFMKGASANIVAYINTAIQRLDDLIGKILSIPGVHVSTGPSKSDPGGVNDPGQPGGPPAPTPPAAPGPTSYNNITINTRDSDRAVRHLRQLGYSA
jgi:murein DD-endopeptidase MepM/ murein hydrolase activator NlpD